jgi:hypothetical protein
MENNFIVTRIFLMLVLKPLELRAVNLNITPVPDAINLYLRLAKIRSAVRVQLTNIKHFKEFPICGLKRSSEILLAPDVPQESLMDILCATVHNTPPLVVLFNLKHSYPMTSSVFKRSPHFFYEFQSFRPCGARKIFS